MGCRSKAAPRAALAHPRLTRGSRAVGTQVVLPSFLGEDPEEIEEALRDFYLIIFRKATEDPAEGDDGSAASLDINLPEIAPE